MQVDRSIMLQRLVCSWSSVRGYFPKHPAYQFGAPRRTQSGRVISGHYLNTNCLTVSRARSVLSTMYPSDFQATAFAPRGSRASNELPRLAVEILDAPKQNTLDASQFTKDESTQLVNLSTQG